MKRLLFILFLMFYNTADCGDVMIEKREEMIQTQIRARGVRDESVLSAMRKVPRHEFVPEESQTDAYEDYPLAIGFGQTISQPYIVALMTELLQPDKKDRVLEIGTGSGYQAAVLSVLVDKVFTIEIIPGLAESAARLFQKNGYRNIFLRCGDGYKGWPEEALFDKIIVTAAPPSIPKTLIQQLKVGGILVIPVGTFSQELLVVRKTEKGVTQKSVIPVRFVPMIEENS